MNKSSYMHMSHVTYSGVLSHISRKVIVLKGQCIVEVRNDGNASMSHGTSPLL